MKKIGRIRRRTRRKEEEKTISGQEIEEEAGEESGIEEIAGKGTKIVEGAEGGGGKSVKMNSPGMLKCVLGWCLPLGYQKLESPTPEEPVSHVLVNVNFFQAKF